MKKAPHTHSRKEKGFTLIEMMVSISIFAIVAVVAVGALLQIIDANKKAQSLKTSINNLNYILESMTREMRVGTHYTCSVSSNASFSNPLSSSGNCDQGSGPWTIAFHSSEVRPLGNNTTCNLVYAYSYDGGTLSKARQSNCNSSIGSNDYYPLLSNVAGGGSSVDATVVFQRGELSVRQNSVGGAVQSSARFRFQGYVGAKERIQTVFDLQTTVAQRIPN